MTQSVNKVILIGNLGRDPEVKIIKDGQKMVKLSLATKDTWKDKDGILKERVEWHNVCIFCDVVAEIASQLKKGCTVYVEGRLQTRKWTNENNIEQYITEIVILKYNGKLIYFNKESFNNSHVGGENFKSNRNNSNNYDYDNIPY